MIRLIHESKAHSIGHLIVQGAESHSIILILVLFISYFFVTIITFVTLSTQLINTCRGHTVESKHDVKTLI